MDSTSKRPESNPNHVGRMTHYDPFYAFYLGEHQNLRGRQLHFMGSLAGLLCLIKAALSAQPLYVLLGG